MRVLILLLAACALSSGGPGTPCAGAGECHDGLICDGPDEFGGCGIPPLEECSSDAGCGEARCHAVADSCASDAVGSQCGASCEEGSCGDGFSCEAGACVAVSCADAPSLCGAAQACDPDAVDPLGPVWDRDHGCRDVVCSDDDGCAAGLRCVNGTCQTSLGECQEFLPVP